MESPLFGLPLAAKEKLLRLARRLPENSQSEFLSRLGNRIAELAYEYPNTLVFASLGWLLGEIIDQLLTISIPYSELTLCLTGGRVGLAGFVGGVIYGLFRDHEERRLRQRVQHIVVEELRRASGDSQ